jgi:hypothetical protein
MNTWPKTIGFGAVQITFTALIHLWCQVVHMRFRAEHPNGHGAAIANICWDYSWVGIAVAVAFAALLVVSHVRKLGALYEWVYFWGIWLLITWFGATLVAMEVAFVPVYNVNGANY